MGESVISKILERISENKKVINNTIINNKVEGVKTINKYKTIKRVYVHNYRRQISRNVEKTNIPNFLQKFTKNQKKVDSR